MLAKISRQPLTGPGGLLEWHPRDVATLADILDDERRAKQRENKGM